MNITKEDINYNKLLVAKSYFNNGKLNDAINLLKKIENDTELKSEKSKLIVKEIAEMYNNVGLKNHSDRILSKLENKETKEFVKVKLQKNNTDVRKFAPPPTFAIEEKLTERNQSISEKIVLAKFYLERRKSQENAFTILLGLVTENEEKSFDSRKVMVKVVELSKKMGLSYMSDRVEEDLIKGKWGKCEPEILNKLTNDEKKDLWGKTKDFAKKTFSIKPLPEGTIPSSFMMKI